MEAADPFATVDCRPNDGLASYTSKTKDTESLLILLSNFASYVILTGEKGIIPTAISSTIKTIDAIKLRCL